MVANKFQVLVGWSCSLGPDGGRRWGGKVIGSCCGQHQAYIYDYQRATQHSNSEHLHIELCPSCAQQVSDIVGSSHSRCKNIFDVFVGLRYHVIGYDICI